MLREYILAGVRKTIVKGCGNMRSWQSALVERLIRLSGMKKKFVDEKALSTYIEKKRRDKTPYHLPKLYKRKYDIEYKKVYGMDCYIYPSSSHSDKQIIYLHGGAYIEQPLIFHWRFLAKLHRQTGAKIIVPIYPKAPNYTYEDSFKKVLPIYQKIIQASDPSTVYLMGDSAGGGFALALAQLLLEKNLPQPQHIILLSPWLDITLENPEINAKLEKIDPMIGIRGAKEFGKLYAGDTDRRNYLLSPIYGNVKGLADMTLFIGTRELILPDARKFKAMAKEQDVDIHYYEYPGMNHVFPVYPIPEAKQALKKIVNIIKS